MTQSVRVAGLVQCSTVHVTSGAPVLWLGKHAEQHAHQQEVAVVESGGTLHAVHHSTHSLIDELHVTEARMIVLNTD